MAMSQELGSAGPAAHPQPAVRRVSRWWQAGCGYLVLLTITAVLPSGCSDKPDGIAFGKVNGTVTLDGQPLPDATVQFQPAAGRPSYGRTDADGRYSLGYRGRSWGAVVGPHTVKITTEDRIENEQTGEVRVMKELLPAHYHARSELTADVTTGENVVDFALTINSKTSR